MYVLDIAFWYASHAGYVLLVCGYTRLSTMGLFLEIAHRQGMLISDVCIVWIVMWKGSCSDKLVMLSVTSRIYLSCNVLLEGCDVICAMALSQDACPFDMK